VILALGLATVAIVVERARALFINFKAPQEGLRKQSLELIAKGDVAGAESLIKSTSMETAFGRIAVLGLHLRGNAAGEEELQARMDEKLNAEISSLDKRTGFLATFGNVATLVGLLGTISGMIKSFAAVAQASPADRSILLSKGISEAMNCTAFGLIVAIPALILYAIYQNKTDKITTGLIESTTELYNDLVFLTVAMPQAEEAPVAAASGLTRGKRKSVSTAAAVPTA